MEIGRISGCTRTIGKSQGYYGLPIRDEMRDGVQQMVSAWLPTPDELAALNAGAPIHLRVVGSGHPPVILTVGEVPK